MLDKGRQALMIAFEIQKHAKALGRILGMRRLPDIARHVGTVLAMREMQADRVAIEVMQRTLDQQGMPSKGECVLTRRRWVCASNRAMASASGRVLMSIRGDFIEV